MSFERSSPYPLPMLAPKPWGSLSCIMNQTVTRDLFSSDASSVTLPLLCMLMIPFFLGERADSQPNPAQWLHWQRPLTSPRKDHSSCVAGYRPLLLSPGLQHPLTTSFAQKHGKTTCREAGMGVTGLTPAGQARTSEYLVSGVGSCLSQEHGFRKA